MGDFDEEAFMEQMRQMGGGGMDGMMGGGGMGGRFKKNDFSVCFGEHLFMGFMSEVPYWNFKAAFGRGYGSVQGPRNRDMFAVLSESFLDTNISQIPLISRTIINWENQYQWMFMFLYGTANCLSL
jgi:hypothetical protein